MQRIARPMLSPAILEIARAEVDQWRQFRDGVREILRAVSGEAFGVALRFEKRNLLGCDFAGSTEDRALGIRLS
jgi:hypothetical protein